MNLVYILTIVGIVLNSLVTVWLNLGSLLSDRTALGRSLSLLHVPNEADGLESSLSFVSHAIGQAIDFVLPLPSLTFHPDCQLMVRLVTTGDVAMLVSLFELLEFLEPLGPDSLV